MAPLLAGGVSRLGEALCREGLAVRINEPYAGLGDGGTNWLRTVFDDSRYAGLEIELNQGLSAAETVRAVLALEVDP